MSKAAMTSLTAHQAETGFFTDYLKLIKMRLTSLVVFTAVMSYLIAAGADFQWVKLVMLAFGGFCVTAASNAINQALEKDFDKEMTRTKDRPVAAGRMSISHAVMIGGFHCLAGVTALATFNVWAAFLGMMAFVTYAFIYTPLKRYSSAAVFVGAIAGAMPMMIGVVAFEGGITILALSLFAIQFAWQYPHFWAIGYLGFEDYQRAGFKFVPTEGDKPSKSIAVSSVIYALLLVGVGVSMFFMGLIDPASLIIATALALIFSYYAIQFSQKFDKVSARKLMFSSLLYLPIVMIVMYIDKLV